MNKKRLSVVMAGAMLASSVAPVLAAEGTSTEVSAAQKGELINSLTGKIWAAERFSAKDKVMPGWSIYGIQINGDVKTLKGFEESRKDTGSETKLQAAIKETLKGIKVGDKVELVNLGVEKRTVDGKEELFSEFVSSTYTKEEVVGGERVDNSIEKQLESLRTVTGFTNVVDLTKSGYDSKENGFVVTFQAGVKTFNNGKPLVIKENSPRLNFNYFKNNSGTIIKFESNKPQSQNVDNFRGFLTADPINLDIIGTVIESTTILPGGNTYNTKDLYDGLFLTTKGYDLLNDAKEVKSLLENAKNATNASKVANAVKVVPVALENGKYTATVKIANPAKVAKAIENNGVFDDSESSNYDSYYITGDSETELRTLVRWLDAIDAAVDKIEGTDRYATAVKLAKEVDLIGGRGVTKNIVLVNGDALVDGLAAAPLAGYLSAKNNNTQAPILLTEKNELPNPTKRYLRELIDQEKNSKITVHIVGGEGVVSNNVKKQLRDLGLEIERYAGEDREETSMAVAKEIGFENGAFVVGATGEADAMSISGYSASRKAPVVVSGFEGLSEDTIDALDGVRVNVIGGDSKISNAEYEEIEAVAEHVNRISGSDRKATNAAVIDTFYKNSFREAESVIVAKDDVLVDALAAANLASVEHAPIVLGRDGLSKAQIAAIIDNAKTADKVYQIGGGVAPSVVKVVAEALKLVNR